MKKSRREFIKKSAIGTAGITIGGMGMTANMINKDKYPSDWSGNMTNKLLETEKQIFLQGYQKAFLLNQTCCGICKDCSGSRRDCKDKKNSRPSPEAFAVDVYQTVRNVGMEITVVSENPSKINRYAFILID